MKTDSKPVAESSDVPEESFVEDLQIYDERDLSFYQKARLLTQSVLFWITDLERLGKRSKYLN